MRCEAMQRKRRSENHVMCMASNIACARVYAITWDCKWINSIAGGKIVSRGNSQMMLVCLFVHLFWYVCRSFGRFAGGMDGPFCIRSFFSCCYCCCCLVHKQNGLLRLMNCIWIECLCWNIWIASNPLTHSVPCVHLAKPSNLIHSHTTATIQHLNRFPANWVWPGEFLRSVPLSAYNYNIKNHLTISTG